MRFIKPVVFKGFLGDDLNSLVEWHVSAYDFYSLVVKNRKRTSERSERVKLFVYFISTEIAFEQ